MATHEGIEALIGSLTRSLDSALEATPKLADVVPPEHGISLLKVKHELLLSYVQNVVFLILLKIRNAQEVALEGKGSGLELSDVVVKKLVELRLYTEKGVRPLEEKLRYQIDNALRAATDEERAAKSRELSGRKIKAARQEDAGSGSEATDQESEGDSDEESGDESDASADETNTESQRHVPNRASFVRRSTAAPSSKSTTGAYRPPRNTPTVMPTHERRERRDRGPLKSATMDEFVADEFSVAPIAEPSIGSNIRARGQLKTATERRQEAERQDYEEANFIRLPKEGKKERAKKAQAEGRSGRMNFGGEEWRGLNEGVDRINRLTKGKGSGTGVRALLEKSRKRGFETTDGPRGSGSGAVEMGERYQKRLKVQSRNDRGSKRR